MSEHDCMLSAFHSTKPSACVQALPLSEPVKRKVSASGEPTSETSKRARGSDLASLASTTEASELGTTVLPRTPCNKSFVEDLVTPTLTSQFNSTTMNDKAPNTPPRPTTPPKSTPDTRDTASSARSITPLRISTSCVDPMCVNPSDSWRRRHQQPDTPTTPTSSQCSSPSTTAQLPKEEAGGPFRYELSGHVFQHNKFYEEFLPVDQVIQTQVREGITASGDLRPNAHLGVSANNTWTIHETISLQRSKIKTFGALVEMLNVLGKGAYETYQMNNEGEQYFRQETLFLNHSSQVAPWDSLSDPAMSLDLAMSSGHELENWGNMQIIIECKSSDDKASRNDAYLQLAHYAQAVFAHQVYRLHVFGFSLCGSIVNFVRFDRSGLLHSSDIDLSIPSGAHSFVKHVITLLTIDTKKFGYDTRYSFGQDSEGNLVDTLFKFPGSDQAEVVSEVLCHRKRYCCGRATCVCALGNDVHKGIWRPKDRPDEGETLALFEGVFGVCQVKAFDYSTYSTELTYVEEVVHSPSASFFYLQKWATNPSASAVQSVCSDTIDASSAPASCASDFPESSESVSAPTTPRVVRVKSDILMPRGTSLFDVQNSLHLLMAIHDALMGIMALTEAGKIHCDISVYNILLVDPGKHYKDQEWLKAPKIQPNPAVWDRAAKGDDVTSSAAVRDEEQACPRLTRAKELKRGPVCVVHDTEFTVDEDKPARTGHTRHSATPAFISGQSLLEFASGEDQATVTFIHDIESLFWVLIWVVADRSQSEDSWQVSEEARSFLEDMTQLDLFELGNHKIRMLSNASGLRALVRGFGNDLCKDLAPVIGGLAEFLFHYLYFEPDPASDPELDPLDMARARLHEEFTSCSRSATFAYLFTILDRAIATLKAKNLTIDFSKL